MPRRCALGCPRSEVPLHCFPHPVRNPDTFRVWVELVGGSLKSPEDYEFYWKKVICDKHFEDKDKNRNNRLNAIAVPSLNLPGALSQQAAVASQSETMIVDVSQPSGSARSLKADPPTATDSLTSTQLKCLDIDNVCEPSTSTCGSWPADLPTATDAPTSSQPKSTSIGNVLCQPSTSPCGESSRILFEHNYFKDETDKKRIMHSGARTTPTFKIRENKIIQRQVKNLKARIKKLQQESSSFKERLCNAEKMNDDASFKRVTKHMKSPAKVFTKMQLQTKKKPSGRRFSLEEKILSLSFYKRSRKCYKMLAHCFTLPSEKTLKSLLAQVKLGSGLIDVIYDNLKETVQQLSPEEKLYSLMFDEMSLTPQINYDNHKDKLSGFSDLSDRKIADHVLVFMIKGVKANFKQPVAYYFTNGLNKHDLKKLIKDVIEKLQGTGLNIITTVCDQGSANVGAIKELVEESKSEYLRKGKAWRHDFFTVGGQKIIPLFDVPHLLKGLRNNLLTKDLVYVDENGQQNIVKWDYFRQVYEGDKCLGELSLLHKITEEHLDPQKIKKMRVSTATQIFSHSMAVVTGHLAARNLINKECMQLIPFVVLINNLFDSLNCSTMHIPNGKIYKGCVKKNTPHHKLWEKAIKLLKSMKFIVKKKTNDNKIHAVESVAPTIKNFIKTIEGMQALWKLLSSKYHLDCMLTRHFNQDPLENFFGNIRSYGARNNSPNTVSFEGAYKALLLNNFNSPHSQGANCEKDNNDCLQNLNFFFKERIEKEISIADVPENSNVDITAEDMIITEEITGEQDTGVKNYVSGWVLKKCLTKVIKGCNNCKERLIGDNETEKNQFIKMKDYKKNKKWLVYPSDECENCFREIQNVTVAVLKKNVPKIHLKAKIKSIIDNMIYFPCSCDVHYESLRKYFEDISINILIYSWCKSINRILAGKIYYVNGDDEIKNIAQIYYNKHKHNKIKK